MTTLSGSSGQRTSTTESVMEPSAHPPASETVYVVVASGEAIGLAQSAQLKPSAGDQAYDVPPPAVSVTLCGPYPLYIVFGCPPGLTGTEGSAVTERENIPAFQTGP